jgi:soluble lytic murein transglycosylase-like protein
MPRRNRPGAGVGLVASPGAKAAGCVAIVRVCAAMGTLAIALRASGALAPSAASLPYMAVLSDGRVLPVAAARLVSRATMRLELGGGAYLEVPAARVQSVVEAAVETRPKGIPRPRCPTSFAPQPLPSWIPYRTDIVNASRAANLHPWLVAAVAQTESGFDRWAVSRVGARGLMQLMPAVWLDNGLADPHDPLENLRAGCAHLRRLLDRFGDLTLALAAYNAGSVSVEMSGGIPPYRETREFVRKVLAVFCPDERRAAK